MVDYHKVVLLKLLKNLSGKYGVGKGNLVDEITKLKQDSGKDIIVYSGALSFNLIGES
jgi:hypothetical protein